MNGLAQKKLSTKLVGVEENLAGELIIKMKRGNEEKQLVWAGFRADIYNDELDWRQFEYGWTEEEFEQYWDDNREDSEIWRNIYDCVDTYDDEEMWEELGNSF